MKQIKTIFIKQHYNVTTATYCLLYVLLICLIDLKLTKIVLFRQNSFLSTIFTALSLFGCVVLFICVIVELLTKTSMSTFSITKDKLRKNRYNINENFQIKRNACTVKNMNNDKRKFFKWLEDRNSKTILSIVTHQVIIDKLVRAGGIVIEKKFLYCNEKKYNRLMKMIETRKCKKCSKNEICNHIRSKNVDYNFYATVIEFSKKGEVVK